MRRRPVSRSTLQFFDIVLGEVMLFLGPREETEGPIISPPGTIMLFRNRGLTEAPSGVYLISRNIYLAKEDPTTGVQKRCP